MGQQSQSLSCQCSATLDHQRDAERKTRPTHIPDQIVEKNIHSYSRTPEKRIGISTQDLNATKRIGI